MIIMRRQYSTEVDDGAWKLRGGLANLNEAEGGNAAPLGEDRAR
jgi:hypothetical protein